jgi:hypothetical protein
MIQFLREFVKKISKIEPFIEVSELFRWSCDRKIKLTKYSKSVTEVAIRKHNFVQIYFLYYCQTLL